ncbi:hypothetical protein EG329_011853 [Mollisiaceae sp. DMI_Dod_QoI]|nr:hypothetical protein EG329_011853 [Helotiales sp. DMI_Dod_QoI]
MYYVSWNKYLNKSSSDLDLKPAKPLKPLSLPSLQIARPKPTPKKPTTTKSLLCPIASRSIDRKPCGDPASTTAALSFPLFAQLPTELRLKIWEHYHAQTTPQLLTFRICPADSAHVPHKRKACFAYPHMLALKQQSIPTILRICSESREVGLGFYRLGFEAAKSELWDKHTGLCSHQSASEEMVGQNRSRKGIYWDPEKDVVHIEVGWASTGSRVYTWGGAPKSLFQDIKYMAMDCKTYWQVTQASMGFSALEVVFMLGNWDQWKNTNEWQGRVRAWDRLLCYFGRERKEKLEVRFVEDLKSALEDLERSRF